MRAATTIFLAGVCWAGGAEASSIITLPAIDGDRSPSVIQIGTPPQTNDPDVVVGEVDEKDAGQGNGDGISLSPSVVVLGEPAVASENVAAIDGSNDEDRRNKPMPLVIRGGVLGDAFSPVASSAPVTVNPQATVETGDVEAPEAAKPGEAPEQPKAAAAPEAPDAPVAAKAPAEYVPPVE